MDFGDNEITITDIEAHVRKHGRKATSQLLNILGRKQKNYNAIMSDEGKILCGYVISCMDTLLDKIVERKATNEELIEYDVLCKILNNWAGKLSDYEKDRKKLKGA